MSELKKDKKTQILKVVASGLFFSFFYSLILSFVVCLIIIIISIIISFDMADNCHQEVTVKVGKIIEVFYTNKGGFSGGGGIVLGTGGGGVQGETHTERKVIVRWTDDSVSEEFGGGIVGDNYNKQIEICNFYDLADKYSFLKPLEDISFWKTFKLILPMIFIISFIIFIKANYNTL